MSFRRTAPAGLIAVGVETITLSNSTASGLNTTNVAGTTFHVSVETQHVRYRADGTSPTVNTGVVLGKDKDHWLEGFPGADLEFQRDTGTCKLSVAAYKRPGE